MKRLIHFLVRRYLPNEGKYIETKIKASSKFYAILLIKKRRYRQWNQSLFLQSRKNHW